MTSTLYSLRTDGDQYRITKFVDSEPEGSYLVSESECECPAGHRHTCRHRQMLPTMLAHKLCDTHWFFDFDRGGQIVDFNGASKHLLDQLAVGTPQYEEPEGLDEENELPDGLERDELSRTQEETVQDTSSLPEGIQMFSLDDPETLYNAIADAVGEPRTAPHQGGTKPWRRL